MVVQGQEASNELQVIWGGGRANLFVDRLRKASFHPLSLSCVTAFDHLGGYASASQTETGPRLGGPYTRRVLAFTDWAIEILSRADTAARRFNPDVRVRIVRDAGSVRFELTDEPGPTDQVVEHPSGFTLLAEEGLEGTVDVVEPHDQLVLRAPGDTERSVREHS